MRVLSAGTIRQRASNLDFNDVPERYEVCLVGRSVLACLVRTPDDVRCRKEREPF